MKPVGVSILTAVLVSLVMGGNTTIRAEPTDSLLVAKDFLTLPRAVVVVADVPQPPQPGGKLQIAPDLGKIMTEELIREIGAALPAATVAGRADESPPPDGLVVECHFSKLDPGSQAKRFWLSFGAGKSVLEVTGEIREVPGDRVVARFVHARSSWCCGVGSNDKEIRNNLVEVATDIASVVAGRFDAEQKVQWLVEEPASKPSSSE